MIFVKSYHGVKIKNKNWIFESKYEKIVFRNVHLSEDMYDSIDRPIPHNQPLCFSSILQSDGHSQAVIPKNLFQSTKHKIQFWWYSNNGNLILKRFKIWSMSYRRDPLYIRPSSQDEYINWGPHFQSRMELCFVCDKSLYGHRKRCASYAMGQSSLMLFQ